MTAAVFAPGQERGDQTEVRGQDVPHICKSEGGESMNCWTHVEKLKTACSNVP